MTIDWLTKIEALLAKAESTTFGEEAEALFAKAQELMAIHAIDEAMLQAANKTREDVVVDTIDIANPYLNQKASLFNAIARANGVKAVITSKPKGSKGMTITCVGFEADIENVKTMYATLSIYAVSDMLKQKIPVYETARGFRVSYLLGFAGRIGERLSAASAQAAKEHVNSTEVGIVLRDRQQDVAAKYRETFAGSNIRSTRPTSYSRAGHRAGQTAASNAGLNKGVGSSRQRALSA